jgi:hypothetical protein
VLTGTTPQPKREIAEKVTIGKDILELLSSGMYVDPSAVFREYLQNAADSIDEAVRAGLFQTGSRPRIDVILDAAQRNITIRDNGLGLGGKSFNLTLTNIGCSNKKLGRARGFRGIGRLGGLAYCQELRMRSKVESEDSTSELKWDCKRWKELLFDSAYRTLEEIIPEIVTVDYQPSSLSPERFFEVKLCSVGRHNNDVLLNEVAVMTYLSQVAPVDFAPGFSFRQDIRKHLDQFDAGRVYDVTVNGKPVYRPHKDSFTVRRNLESRFTKLELFHVPGISTDLDAIGWLLHSPYLGAIPEKAGFKGLRLRAGNIQIGDADLLNRLFQEPRFNSWSVGEFHVLNPKLIPNGRRDDFEQNSHYANLINQLRIKAKMIAQLCRKSSAKRSQTTDNKDTEAVVNWTQAREFLNKNGQRTLSRFHTKSLRRLLRQRARYGEFVALLTRPGTNAKDRQKLGLRRK